MWVLCREAVAAGPPAVERTVISHAGLISAMADINANGIEGQGYTIWLGGAGTYGSANLPAIASGRDITIQTVPDNRWTITRTSAS